MLRVKYKSFSSLVGARIQIYMCFMGGKNTHVLNYLYQYLYKVNKYTDKGHWGNFRFIIEKQNK